MMTFRPDVDHERLRRAANKAFTPRRIASFTSSIQSVVDELLDAWPTSGSFDLVPALTFPLPARVICRVLGIPRERIGDIQRWADGIVGLLSAGIMTEEAARRATVVLHEASTYLDELIEEKRRDPGADLLSALVEVERTDGDFTVADLRAVAIQLFFAGFGTTEGVIGNALAALLRNHAVFAGLRGGTEYAHLVTEEALRFDTSVQSGRRVALEDVTIGGESIPQGGYVLFMIGAAHRDPRRFERPDTFDPERSDQATLAFGQGSHFCLGAALARLEIQIALRSVAKRFPDLALAGEVTYGDLLAVRKPRSLPVSIAG